jgi:hypothetical protein
MTGTRMGGVDYKQTNLWQSQAWLGVGWGWASMEIGTKRVVVVIGVVGQWHM